MREEQSRKRLGRGLAALIGEMDEPAERAGATVPAADRALPIEFIERNPSNPRRHFDPEELADLAQSIGRHGLVQPVVVRRLGPDRYELIAGERRWRAAQAAGLAEIPVLVRDVDDRTALELAIVENVQRADLNPLEEAQGYAQLIADHGYTQSDLGDIIGKSRSHVANTLRLLKLPPEVRDMIGAGRLSAGHARAIAATDDPVTAARAIVDKGMSVREAERLAQQRGQPQTGAAGQRREDKDADTLALERRLSDALGLKVTVNHKAAGGQIRIDYRSVDQLEEVCRLLGSYG